MDDRNSFTTFKITDGQLQQPFTERVSRSPSDVYRNLHGECTILLKKYPDTNKSAQVILQAILYLDEGSYQRESTNCLVWKDV